MPVGIHPVICLHRKLEGKCHVVSSEMCTWLLCVPKMASPKYLLRNSAPWIAVLVPPSLLLAIFSGHDSGNESGEDDDEHSSSFSEEDSDADWPFSSGNNSGHSPHCSSDCSISDEESLIELALPSGHFLGLQKPAVDLFAEINEEDNMIEIDIYMGSIKCSRFEIIEA
nr:Eukaryotic translation initiation factor 3 subunit C like [Ipomoea batatas]GME11950.1 Eukaryotic translation initiation factor 3 subunit C like [Ipomoea batatas]